MGGSSRQPDVARGRPGSHDERPVDAGFVIAQTALLLIPLLIFAAFRHRHRLLVRRGPEGPAGRPMPQPWPAWPTCRTSTRPSRPPSTPQPATATPTPPRATAPTSPPEPVPQVKVTSANGDALDVEIRTEAGTYLGRLVLDTISIQRYAIAEYIQPVHMGNPTSGLGTGTIPEASLGLPNDKMWLSVTAYCQDHEQGDPFAVGYYDGPTLFNSHRTCGTGINAVFPVASPNPTFDPDAYVFVTEFQPGSPAVSLEVYEPGVGCSDTGSTGDWTWAPILNFEIYGPSTTTDHRAFIDANSPISIVSHPWERLHRQQPPRRRVVVAGQQPADPRPRRWLLLREGQQPASRQLRRLPHRPVLARGADQQLLAPGSPLRRQPALRLLGRRSDLPPAVRPRLAAALSAGPEQRGGLLPGRGAGRATPASRW